MTREQYLQALGELGLTVASLRTAYALGVSLAQIKRIAAGTQKVPAPVAKLLTMYLRHGCVPKDMRRPE